MLKSGMISTVAHLPMDIELTSASEIKTKTPNKNKIDIVEVF
jgi:hypothetical protein